ncbi:MAG: hypothetical protein ACLFT8_03400 [Desulfovermiculus sp.]
MLKSFRKLVKQFQSLPERDFRHGRTVEQTLEYIASLGQDAGSIQELRRHLYAHDPKIRQAAAQALQARKWSPRSAADTQIFLLSLGSGAEVNTSSASRCLIDWESETSLAPGAYWTPVVLAGLVHKGTQAKPELYGVAAHTGRSLNTRRLALWAIGLIGEQTVWDLYALFEQQNIHQLQQAVIQALYFSGPDAIPAFVSMLSEEKDQELALELALSLSRMGTEAVSELGKLLQNEQRMVRENAGFGLLASADPLGLSWLFSLKASDRDGRLKAVISEWMIGLQAEASTWKELSSPETASALCSPVRILQGLTRTDNELLTSLYLSMLARIPGGDAVPVLREIITTTGSEDILFPACLSLSAQPAAESELRHMLKKGNPLIRTYACLALLKAGFPVMQVLAET